MYSIFEYRRQQNLHEIWLLPKRCGSSFTHDLIDYSSQDIQLEAINFLDHPDYFDSEGENPTADLSFLYVPPGRAKVVTTVRGPFARYCSGLSMLPIDPYREMQYWEELLTDPDYKPPSWIKLPRTRGDLNLSLQNSFFSRFIDSTIDLMMKNDNKFPIIDFSFGESHLTPILSMQLLFPFYFNSFEFVVLEDFTRYSERSMNVVLNLDERNGGDIMHQDRQQYNRETSDRPSEHSLMLFKTLQKKLPQYFSELVAGNQKYRSSVGTEKTFSKWLEPEWKAFAFIKDNIDKQHYPDFKVKLEDLIIELLQDKLFFLRTTNLGTAYTHPMVFKCLSSRVQHAIRNNIIKVRQLYSDNEFTSSFLFNNQIF